MPAVQSPRHTGAEGLHSNFGYASLDLIDLVGAEVTPLMGRMQQEVWSFKEYNDGIPYLSDPMLNIVKGSIRTRCDVVDRLVTSQRLSIDFPRHSAVPEPISETHLACICSRL